jgi:membrane glycosyltransferase
MLAHTLMVLSIMLGKAVGWGNQNREADGTAWRDALRFHAVPTVLGSIWAVVAWQIGFTFLIWMSPILAGLILSSVVSVLTSRSRYGLALADAKILSTPEELNPPQILRLADEAASSIDPALDAATEARRGVVAAVVDPYVNGVHVSLLEAGELSPTEEALAERCLLEGPAALSKNELSELLYLAPAMLAMHRGVWLRPSESIHQVWSQAVQSYRRRLDQPANE